MKHKKNLFLCLIAILAIFSIVSCGGNELPSVPDAPNVDPDKPIELPLKESANLDAWREVVENTTITENGKTEKVNCEFLTILEPKFPKSLNSRT